MLYFIASMNKQDEQERSALQLFFYILARGLLIALSTVILFKIAAFCFYLLYFPPMPLLEEEASAQEALLTAMATCCVDTVKSVHTEHAAVLTPSVMGYYYNYAQGIAVACAKSELLEYFYTIPAQRHDESRVLNAWYSSFGAWWGYVDVTIPNRKSFNFRISTKC